LEAYEIAYLFLGLATLVASGTIINYSRKRSAATPDPDTRKAFRPLYIFAIGLLVFGIGSLLTFYELFTGVPLIQISEVNTNFYYFFYYIIIIELFLFAISAALILEQRIIGIFMISMVVIAYLLMFNAVLILEASRVSSQAQFFIDFGYVLIMIILAAVAVLFSWIAYETRRSTSLSLAYALALQMISIPALRVPAILTVGFITAISILALMGPAMIAFAFLRPDQKISGELVGYGAAFAAPVVVFTAVLTSAYAANLVIVAIGLLGSVAIMFVGGSASYLYGRWRETKQSPTLLLMLSFGSFAVGQLIGILGTVGIFDPIWSSYVDLVASSLALVLYAVVSILAAGYRASSLLPMLVWTPAIIFLVSSYPLPLSAAVERWIFLVLPVMIFFFVPVILFAGVWRRMKQAGQPRRMRPLGMSVGLLIYVIIRFPLLLLDILVLDPGYGLIVIPEALLWLAITGRLDRTTS
jgi:hypothetical protein